MTRHLLGFDVGGTKCAVILASTDGSSATIVSRRSWPTVVERGPAAIITDLIASGRALLADATLTSAALDAIGISCGGPLDTVRGVVLGPPNLPGWDCVPIADRLSEAFGVPAHLENDANAGAVAEWRWGAGRGTATMVFLTCGTGMGAGLIIDGRLFAGAGGLAGEVGHIRLADSGPHGHGKDGSFEGFCSGGGIARAGRTAAERAWAEGRAVAYCADRSAIERVSARDIAEAARAGDATAQAVYREAGRRLGQGLAIIADVLAPDMIVIGGIFARSRDLLWPDADRVMSAEALAPIRARCRVVASELGETIGDFAAVAAAPDLEVV